MELSIVIPAYNERDALKELCAAIEEHVDRYTYEIVFVDDGSTDGSDKVLNELEMTHSDVRVIRFKENQGKTAALAAGFAEARGDIVVTLDADLQDDPKEIPRMVEAVREGADLVCGWKKKRLDPWHKTIPSKIYNAIIDQLFGLTLHDSNTGFKAMRSKVAKSMPLFGAMHRFIPVFAHEKGFEVVEIPVEHHPRKYGRSKYGFSRFVTAPFDIALVWMLMRTKQAPKTIYDRIGNWQFYTGGLLSLICLMLSGAIQAVLAVLGIVLIITGSFCFWFGRIANNRLKELSDTQLRQLRGAVEEEQPISKDAPDPEDEPDEVEKTESAESESKQKNESATK